MSKRIAMGCDVGNTSVKIRTALDYYRIDTIVRQPSEARMIFGKGDVGNAVDFLDVDIESKDISGNYYVGSLASGNGSQESIGGLKSENKILKVAALTSLAYVLSYENPDENEFEIPLGTGLPVNEYFMKNVQGKYDFANVKKYIDQFQGTHKIKFNTKLLENRVITLNINPDKISVLPESYAGLLTVVNDQNGLILPEYAKKNVNVLGVDLGGGSSDFAGFTNDDYIEECMFGFDIGINEAQDRLCEDIKTRARLKNFNRHDLNCYLYDPEYGGKLETNRGSFNLNEEKIQYYKPIVKDIVYNFKRKLNNNGFDISMINKMFMFGGASKEIGNMIKDELKSEIKNIEIAPKPITRNVDAYYNTVKEFEE